MAIALNPYGNPERWTELMSGLLPDEEIRVWPDLGEPSDIEFVVAWRMPRSALATFTNLQAILSVSAGAEQWLRPGTPDVPVVRLADPAMSRDMAAFCLHWVLRFHRRFDEVADQQAKGVWQQLPYVPAESYRVGILGYGTIGERIGQSFLDLGYSVNGWSRSGRTDETVQHFAGADQLSDFLAASDAVISVLPNTPETTGVLNADTFAEMRDGSVLINVGRGNAVVETDLLAALTSGPLQAAVLDVTDPEPPEPDSPLFAHPGVHLTSHVAGQTGVETSAVLIADNIRRIRAGETPFPLLDRTRGY